MSSNTFYTKKKEPIDLSKYKCPHDKKHTLRLSTDNTYCDIWCNTCKTGWKESEIKKIVDTKSTTLLIPIPDNGDDYYLGVYLTINPQVKEELKRLKALTTNFHHKYSLTIPWATMQYRTFAILLTELDFENDTDRKYRDEIYERLFDRKEILKPENFKNKLAVSRNNTELFDKFDDSQMVITQSGVRFESDYENIKTPEISWSKLIID